ncbi:MAG: COX15/CtaA family protein [Candidatus Acidiferrales bacterium]
MTTKSQPALHRFAVFTACFTFLTLIAGALVTSKDAGLSVPDWPLAYGKFVPPLVGGIVFEYSHRVIATFIGSLTIVLAVWLALREPRRWVRRIGFLALAIVITQGLLGGMTVLFFQPPAVSTAHATLAQLFFCVIVSLCLFTSRWWQSDLPAIDSPESARIQTLAHWTVAAVLLQLILGAAFRHKAFGLLPHLVGAVVVTVLIFALAGRLKRAFPNSPALCACARALHILIGIQLLLGGAAWWSRGYGAAFPQPILITVVLTVSHVVTGALLFAATVVTALVCRRLLRPAASVAIDSVVPVEQAHGEQAALGREQTA